MPYPPIEDVVGAFEEINAAYCAEHLSDGLPIVPPAPSRLAKMLECTSRAREDVVATLPPYRGLATVEKIAINAIMAGCLPEYLPVVIAAVEALAEERFNLYGVQATTNPATPLLIVNGPIRKKLGVNAGGNAFGPGWRANATIGRAVRLILLNIGGGRPGTLDKATQGQAAKYTYCVAENEEESPWEPLHVERGFDRNASTVTVVGASANHNIIDTASQTPHGILTTIAGAMATIGTNDVIYGGEPFLAVCPEHAKKIAMGGFTKADVKRFLFYNARVSLARFSRENQEEIRRMRSQWCRDTNEHTELPVATRPEEINVFVVGGIGPHSQYLATFGTTRSVTKLIEA